MFFFRFSEKPAGTKEEKGNFEAWQNCNWLYPICYKIRLSVTLENFVTFYSWFRDPFRRKLLTVLWVQRNKKFVKVLNIS